MSDIQTSVPFPVDSDGFLRRECPLCHRDFKVFLFKEELTTLAQKGIESFMLKKEEHAPTRENEENIRQDLVCPYCGQCAPKHSWWTQEQVAYINVIVRNITARLVNQHLVRPLKRAFARPTQSPISFQFKGKEMDQEEPWISPEPDDMEILDLPCCERKIKIAETWTAKVHCFFCGFLHTGVRNG